MQLQQPLLSATSGTQQDPFLAVPSSQPDGTSDGAFGQRPMLFSYASPHQVKQAKLEAMQFKLQQRLKAMTSKPDHEQFEMCDTKVEDRSTPGIFKTTQGPQRGSIEQFQALIVPPEVGSNGAEKNATSKFVSLGRQQDFQRLKAAIRLGSNSTIPVGYQPVDDQPREASPKKRPISRASVPRSKPKDKDGGPRKDRAADQLQKSLTISFVPVRVNAAGMPQRALGSSAHVYETMRSEVDRLLLLPHRVRRKEAASGPAAKLGWSGFVDSKLEPSVARAIEEDLSGKRSGGTDSPEQMSTALKSQEEAAAAALLAAAGALSNIPVRAARSGQQVGSASHPAPAPKQQAPAATAAAAGRPAISAGPPPRGKIDASHELEPQSPTQNAQHTTTNNNPKDKDRVSAGISTATMSNINADSAQPISGAALRQVEKQCTSQLTQQRPKGRPASAAPAASSWSGGLHSSAPPHLVSRPAMSMISGAVTRQRPETASSQRSENANMTVWDRLNATTRNTIVPTTKTMARVRSGCLFQKTNMNSSLFSVTTPCVADLEAAFLSLKREDLQYRVLEYKAKQVYRGCYGGDAEELAASTVASRGRPASAPSARTAVATHALTNTMTSMHPPPPLPPKPTKPELNKSLTNDVSRPPSGASHPTIANSVARPRSALHCSSTGVVSNRLRPPSAGAWAGRPVKTLLEEEGEDEVVLEEGWDQGTGGNLPLMQVTAGGTLLSV
ncbi:hypothetical protein CEUSTIGMA_g4892.t1 [Chlamydomonas eustigma]|uniref:Uncharacterized protein n=1 Tax=Chlamydomonas eustigma TaxID=1157962 RepID=A0A250X2Z6_9CHLO|nr:hypothetical protein CEUSTIGMA_g4892.t1 [Chlamydomonas eustigma]|eukprot:GAX77447.1 hypothetical protein CEUSTIGMA_g4892.t1 [Chlamydomonas eustigma]